MAVLLAVVTRAGRLGLLGSSGMLDSAIEQSKKDVGARGWRSKKGNAGVWDEEAADSWLQPSLASLEARADLIYVQG